MSEQLLESVESKYGAVAESTLSSDHAGVKAVAKIFGYSAEELMSIPCVLVRYCKWITKDCLVVRTRLITTLLQANEEFIFQASAL